MTTIWDGSRNISFSSGWQKIDDGRFFGHSYMRADFISLNSSASASLNFSFQGTIVSFWGITPFNHVKLPISVTIDSVPQTPLDYREPNGTYSEVYRSHSLQNGQHTISISNLYGVYIDSAVVFMEEGTPGLLEDGTTMLVDNSRGDIHYHGNWTHSTGEMFSTSSTRLGGEGQAEVAVRGRAMGNGTHSTTSVGDGFSVSFNGTLPSIYGIIDTRINGTIHITFTVDGVPSIRIYRIPGPDNNLPNRGHLLNHLFYQTPNLKPGPHTLTAHVTSITPDQSFIFDYFTYQWSSHPSSSGSNEDGNPNVNTTIPPFSSLPSDHNEHDRKKPLVGPVVGGVLGAVAVLVILVVLLILLYKRKKKAERIRKMILFHVDTSKLTVNLNLGDISDVSAQGSPKSPLPVQEPEVNKEVEEETYHAEPEIWKSSLYQEQ